MAHHFSGALEQTGKLVEAEQAVLRAIAILERLMAPTTTLSDLGKNDLAKESRARESAIRQTYSTQDAVIRVGEDVRALRAITSREAPYSQDARKAKIQGVVVLSLVVGTRWKTSRCRRRASAR
jgi:hypothetical protein